MWLLDKNENIKQKLRLISAVHIEEINAENSLSFEMVGEIEKKDRIIYKDDLNEWHEFIVQEIVENKHSINVYAEHSSYELHGDFVEDKRPEGTPNHHLSSILSETRWSVGFIEGFPTKKTTYYRQSVYECINQMCNLFNAYRKYEIVVENGRIVDRKINILKEIGEDNGKRFTYTKDLNDVERTVLDGEVVTALYGFGRGEEIGDGYGRRISFKDLDKEDSPSGYMYIFDEELKELWGRNSPTGKKHIFQKVEFDEIEDAEELYEATKEKFKEVSQPRINYKANVVLLKELNENVRLGDTVRIVDKSFNNKDLRLIGKVIKIERDLVNPTNSIIEFGNYIENIADADLQLKKFVNDFRDKVGVWDKSNAFDEHGKLSSSFIKDILEGWNDALNGTSGFVYASQSEGIITYDRAIEDNPTMAIQITGGGFRIANSKKSNGDWDWRTVGTGDGIYGDQIISNSITANKLASDVGSSLDLSSNESINMLVQQIENIEFGGRNYILNSREISGSPLRWSDISEKTWDEWVSEE